VVDRLTDTVAALRGRKAMFVSNRAVSLPAGSSETGRGLIVRDPDGHALEIREAPAAKVSAE
jgi:hypothetical protein